MLTEMILLAHTAIDSAIDMESHSDTLRLRLIFYSVGELPSEILGNITAGKVLGSAPLIHLYR